MCEGEGVNRFFLGWGLIEEYTNTYVKNWFFKETGRGGISRSLERFSDCKLTDYTSDVNLAYFLRPIFEDTSHVEATLKVACDYFMRPQP